MGARENLSASCFADVLDEHVTLTPAERAALESLEERRRVLKRGALLVRENERSSEICVLRQGLMMSYVLLPDGSRQILRFLFPGDLIGIASAIYTEAPENICALSDCVVCPFERPALSALTEAHPRLAMLILIMAQVERVVLTDRLAMLGRTSAKARVGGLLLDMRNRLRATNKGMGDTFPLGLTQEQIGDATGLTSVHVNRMLRQLEDEGLIARAGGRVTIRDEATLVATVNYVDRYQGLDLSWLPPAR